MWVSTTAQNSARPGGREHLWVRRVEPIEDRRVDVLACTRTYTAPWMRAQRRLAKPGPGATRPRRAARGRVDAHTGTSLVKTPRAIHPRRDGVARGGAWPAARAPDTRIAPARRAAMDRAPGRADRRSRLLSTPRSPPGPAPGSVLAARLWQRERRRSPRRGGAAARPRSPRGGGPHAAPRPVQQACSRGGYPPHCVAVREDTFGVVPLTQVSFMAQGRYSECVTK